MIQNEIRQLMTDRRTLQNKTLGGVYSFRLSTWSIRLGLNSKYSCKELREALKTMPDVEVDTYHSRRGQTCWRFK